MRILPGFIRFAYDNIEIGIGIFHASQSDAFRRGTTGEQMPHIKVKLAKDKNMRVPPELNNIKESHIGSWKPEPVFHSEVSMNFSDLNPEEVKQAVFMNMCWMLARLVNPKKQYGPAWSGFNESASLSKSVPVTIVGHLPIINAPADDNDVIWTVIDRCQKMTNHLGQRFTVITCDEQL